MSNHAPASTNIDQEKELSCLILWLEATAQVIGDLLSGFGPARAWIDKHRDELARGKLTKEWHDRVAEFDNGRTEIIATADKALYYAGRVVGIVPSDYPKEAIDLLAKIQLRAESFSYLGVLWESLDDYKFTFENEMPDDVQRLEHLVKALRVLRVTPKEEKKQQRDTVRRASPALSIKQFGKALIMDPYRVFKPRALAEWELKSDNDANTKWTIDYNLLHDPGKERQIEEHADSLRGKQKKSSAT